MEFKLLDHGYLKFIEGWGFGESGLPEAAIIEAARQSTQGSFRQWAPYELCEKCGTWRFGETLGFIGHEYEQCKTHEWKNYPRGDEGLLKFLHDHKHSTPFEFCGMTIEVQAPIVVFREWHRHRTQSYSEASARYAPLPALDYLPTVDRCLMLSQTNKQAGAIKGSDELTSEQAMLWLDRLNDWQKQGESLYQRGLRIGLPKEIARGAMSVFRYSRMRATANLRNWLGFLLLRMDESAQWEIRQFANAVGEIIKAKFPRTWSLFRKEK